jgi:hypothetical protein
LCEPIALVDIVEDAVDVGLGLQGRVKRCVVDGGSELSVGKDIGISSDRGLIESTRIPGVCNPGVMADSR